MTQGPPEQEKLTKEYKMSNIYEFPIENLRKEIGEGYVSDKTKNLIRTVLADITIYKPNSWDRRFCEDMLTNSRLLTAKQSQQLDRILHDILRQTEHPSFTPGFDF